MADEVAVLAGGCFWCTEAVFLDVVGVKSVESGYTGGQTANPTYKQKLLIGTLLGLPADPTLTANFIGTMQKTYQDQAQSGQAAPGMNQQKSVHIDINPEAIATETSRISNK